MRGMTPVLLPIGASKLHILPHEELQATLNCIIMVKLLLIFFDNAGYFLSLAFMRNTEIFALSKILACEKDIIFFRILHIGAKFV